MKIILILALLCLVLTSGHQKAHSKISKVKAMLTRSKVSTISECNKLKNCEECLSYARDMNETPPKIDVEDDYSKGVEGVQEFHTKYAVTHLTTTKYFKHCYWNSKKGSCHMLELTKNADGESYEKKRGVLPLNSKVRFKSVFWSRDNALSTEPVTKNTCDLNELIPGSKIVQMGSEDHLNTVQASIPGSEVVQMGSEDQQEEKEDPAASIVEKELQDSNENNKEDVGQESPMDLVIKELKKKFADEEAAKIKEAATI